MTVHTDIKKTGSIGITPITNKSIASAGQDFRMSKFDLFCLDGDQRGVELSALQGLLWVTQLDDPNDHILSSGEKMVVTLRGRVVVEAIMDSLLKITSARILPHDKVDTPNFIGSN